MFEQNIRVKEETECWTADSFWWQESTCIELFFWVQKYWDSSDIIESIERWEVGGDHKIQVSGIEEKHLKSRVEAPKDQLDNKIEEPQSSSPNLQIHPETMIPSYSP